MQHSPLGTVQVWLRTLFGFANHIATCESIYDTIKCSTHKSTASSHRQSGSFETGASAFPVAHSPLLRLLPTTHPIFCLLKNVSDPKKHFCNDPVLPTTLHNPTALTHQPLPTPTMASIHTTPDQISPEDLVDTLGAHLSSPRLLPTTNSRHVVFRSSPAWLSLT